MRFARKLMLLALAAIAAMAVAATPAFGEAIEVVDEDNSQHCSLLSESDTGPDHLTGGCIVHAVGTATLRVDLVFFELNEATCDLELLMRVGEDGQIAIDQLEHDTGPDGNCATVTAEEELPWEGAGEENPSTGDVDVSTLVHIDPVESEDDCIGNIAASIVEGGEEDAETYSTEFDNATVGLCELDVSLAIENNDPEHPEYESIHINHL